MRIDLGGFRPPGWNAAQDANSGAHLYLTLAFGKDIWIIRLKYGEEVKIQLKCFATRPEFAWIGGMQKPDPQFEMLAAMPRDRLRDMNRAGKQVLECYRLLKKTGANVVGQVLANQGAFYQWNHFPKGDVFDRETCSQYYYHAHLPPEIEHGHFHTFIRTGYMPDAPSPTPYDGEWQRPLGKDAICHLVAISMDANGYPLALFGVNRWVTGETFYNAEDAIALLDSFEIDLLFPCHGANRWISAMLRLFHPQAAALLRQRDAAIQARQKAHPGTDVYEDRKLETTSITPISVVDQITAIRKLLR